MRAIRLLFKRWFHVHNYGKWDFYCRAVDRSYGEVKVTNVRTCSECGHAHYKTERVQ